MNLILVPLHGGASISLDKAIVFFGRGSECDVVLADSRKVSRKHCCVAQIDNRIMIRDLGSMNGVRINDVAVKEETQLRMGDVLWVGDLGFRLEPAAATGLKVPGIAKRVPLPRLRKSFPEVNAESPAVSRHNSNQQEKRTSSESDIIPVDQIIDLENLDIPEDDEIEDELAPDEPASQPET